MTIALEPVEFVQLIKVSVDANNNKFWNARLMPNDEIWVHNGRVGTKGQNRLIKDQGKSAFDRRVREQLSEGYKPVQTVTTDADLVVDVKQLALAQIRSDPETVKLIEYLSQVNIHQITAGTKLTYQGNGTFTTPLGIVTKSAISQARLLLNQLGTASHDRIRLLNEYLMLIPQDLGRQLSHSLFSTPQQLQQQSDLLDALEAVIPTATTTERVFDCSLNLVPHSTKNGRETFRSIRARFEASTNSHHRSSAFKLKRVYEIQIPSIAAAFESSIGNIQSLWHGTRASNLLSILKQGLIIPPASASQCTGRMFGNGLYFSNQSTKSLNYATDFWNRSGASNQRAFMLLADVALGREFHPPQHQSSIPTGYDSMWVEGGTCNVINHEAIVYRTSQVNLKFLCEFSTSND